MNALSTARAFVIALSVAVVIDDCLRWILVSTREPGTEATPVQSVSFVIQILVNIAYLAVIAGSFSALRTNRLPTRRQLDLLGILASANMAITIAAISLSIYVRGTGSYRLLIESFALYVSINLVFLFWYWYADYPLRDGTHIGDAVIDLNQGIQFPEEALAIAAGVPASWRPGLIDYAYFTLLSSNCLGAPEGHMLVGRTLKGLQIVHTVFILFLFVILLARAVNTLS